MAANEHLSFIFASKGEYALRDSKDLLQFYESSILPFKNSNVYCLPLTSTQLLTKPDIADINAAYEYAFSLEDVNREYEAGDTIGILPQNSDKCVYKLFELLDCSNQCHDEYIAAPNPNDKKSKLPKHVPAKGTMYNLFKYHLDLRSVPKKMFLKGLVPYCSSSIDVEKLIFMTSPAGSAAYNSFLCENGRSLLGILSEFSSCKPSVAYLMQHLPVLKPRPYSISSSPFEKDTLRITFSVRPGSDAGVCSAYLESLLSTQNAHVFMYFRTTSSFHLPSTADLDSTPMVMIALGTGIAPFIGFLRHLKLVGKDDGSVHRSLFYGCRHEHGDYLYRDELEQYLKGGTLTHLISACSRDQPQKIYVQHRLLEQRHVLDGIEMVDKCRVYMCGVSNAIMQDVRNGLSAANQAFGKALEKDGRYFQEIWA